MSDFVSFPALVELQEALAKRQQALREHRLYTHLETLADVRVFMEHHVYAVWDFMSLLKALQQRLTCLAVPWMPPAHPEAARFINEIVLGEESDIDPEGRVRSHFMLYLEAMEQIGASTGAIRSFLPLMQSKLPLSEAMREAQIPQPSRPFLEETFSAIHSGNLHCIASAFTFGREGLIPDLFLAIVRQAEQRDQTTYGKLTYYLQRHIELDGDEHGPLANRMMEAVCGNDEQKWTEARHTAELALDARIKLWDGIANTIAGTRRHN